tara:strand:- start:244 stop:1734 length:1491 start_codon:yes stop_codon:yes gene_type:complete
MLGPNHKKEKPFAGFGGFGGGGLALAFKSGGESFDYWSLGLRINSYENTNSVAGGGPKVDNDGNVYFAFIGTDNGNTLGENQACLVKTDSGGVVKWVKSFTDTVTQVQSTTIDVSGTGEIYYAWRRNSLQRIEQILLNTNGSTQTWSTRIGQTSTHRIFNTIANKTGASGGHYVTGQDYDRQYSEVGAFYIAKLSATGTISDDKGFIGASTQNLNPGRHFGIDSSENTYHTLEYYEDPMASNGYKKASTVIKYNSSLSFQWAKEFKINNNPTDWDLIDLKGCDTDSSGNTYAWGRYVHATRFSGSRGFFAKIDSSGSLQWVRENPKDSDGRGGEITYSGVVDSSGNFYWTVSGIYNSSAGRYSVVVHKCNSSGTMQWTREMYINNLTSSGIGWGMVSVDSNDNLYVMGYAKLPTSSGPNGMYVLKVKTDGTETGTYGNVTWATRSTHSIQSLTAGGDISFSGSPLSDTSVAQVDGTFTTTNTDYSTGAVNELNGKS